MIGYLVHVIYVKVDKSLWGHLAHNCIKVDGSFFLHPNIFLLAPPHSYEKTKSPLLVLKISEISLT